MKKVWLAIIFGLIAGGIGTGIYLASGRAAGKSSQPPAEVAQESAADLTTWKDPNGFTFQYPSGLTLNKHDEDKQNYAHLEFTHPDHQGNVVIWGKDTTAADVTAWARTEKKFTGANILDSTLGEKPAKKILLSDPTTMIIVGAVFDGIVWTVEAQLVDDYWTNVHRTISDSFKFIPLEGESTAGGTAPLEEEIYADEEEVIE